MALAALAGVAGGVGLPAFDGDSVHCTAMDSVADPGPAAWRHRGCRVALETSSGSGCRFRITHPSGLCLGEVSSLGEARGLIDDQITLVRQRLVAGI